MLKDNETMTDPDEVTKIPLDEETRRLLESLPRMAQADCFMLHSYGIGPAIAVTLPDARLLFTESIPFMQGQVARLREISETLNAKKAGHP